MYWRASLVAQAVEICLQCRNLGSNHGLEWFPGKGNDNPLWCLAWRIPWTEETSRLQSMGSQRAEYDWEANTYCSLVQSLIHVRLFATPWTAAHQASLAITNSWSLLKLLSIELVMSFNHLILCRPLLLLPSIFPSIRVFSNESILHIRWPKYWSFNFSISPSNEHSGMISFRLDWLDLLAVQGTLKSLLQHHTQFKSINSLMLIFPYSPTLTSIYDYWKNRSLD